MSLWSGNEQLLCKVFPSTIGEIASDWFLKLPKGCIKNYEGLAEMLDSLLALKIDNGESLRAYAKRYYEVYNRIPTCNQELAIVSFKNSLENDCPLWQSLAKTLLKSMEDLMARIKKYARVEEDKKTKKVSVVKQEKRNDISKRSRGNNGIDKPKHGLRVTQAMSTVLKISIYRILEKIKKQPYFRAPQKTSEEYMDRNPGKNCAYHDENGHMTQGCWTLKKHPEDLVRHGHLKDLIDETKTR
ncbi:uncharacterized protein LOC114282689 [Camellia sinensis]|uniref:uncharacterized protein LOC114282689 n=1 Tax=Camellia sinensis TaxID=4442 RepID=UPI00103697C2|nr:uncharacterized protein LOC114282689 [Camellia sinensis]